MIPWIGSGTNGFTVITALPLRSAAIDVQLASASVAMVYVVFTVGATGITNVVLFDVNGTVVVLVFTPPYGVTTVIVPDHGPVPLSVSVRLAFSVPQICAVPDITPVARAFIVTVTDPVLSPAFAVQRESLSVAIV